MITQESAGSHTKGETYKPIKTQRESTSLPSLFVNHPITLSVRPEIQPGNHGPPKFLYDHIPSYSPDGRVNCCVGDTDSHRRAYPCHKNDGACHWSRSSQLRPLGHNHDHDRGHDHGPNRGRHDGPSPHRDRQPEQTQRGNRGPPKSPDDLAPSYNLPGM